MYRLTCFFVFFFYIIPFLLSTNHSLFFELLATLIILFSFYVGGFVADYLIKGRPIENYSGYFFVSNKIYTAAFLFYVLFRFGYIVDVLGHFLDGSYLDWALQNAIDRYEGYNEKDYLFKLGSIIFFMYSFLLPWSEIKSKFKYIIFVFMILIESSDLARAGVLLALSSFFVELYIKHNDYFSKLNACQYIKYIFIVVLLLFLVFLFSAYGRLSENENMVELLIEKIAIYTLAMYQAFLLWFRSSIILGGDLGFNSFTFIYKIIGVDVDQGFYKLIDTDFGSTNVYSVLRGLLADFGVVITTFFYFTAGFLINFYSKVRMNLISYFFVRFFCLMIVFLLISPFSFFTYFCGFLLSFFILVLINHDKKNLYNC